MKGRKGMKGRKEGKKGEEWNKGKEGRGGGEMNWMPVLVPRDHPGDQDRPGASPGHPVLVP